MTALRSSQLRCLTLPTSLCLPRVRKLAAAALFVLSATASAAELPAASEPIASAPGEAAVHGPRLRLRVGGTSNWRTYCARPGVEACADFDVRQDPASAGTSVDQNASVYLGFAVDAATRFSRVRLGA